MITMFYDIEMTDVFAGETNTHSHMNHNDLITALLAGAENNPSKVQLEDEDFVMDLEGEWVKENGHYSTVTLLRAFDMASRPFMHTFNPFTPQEERDRLSEVWKAENELAVRKLEERIAKLVRHRLVTSFEYRMIRYVTKRADEILAAQNEKP